MWQDLLLNVLRSILLKATPDVRQKLTQLLDDWEEKAKATPNPFDDLLVFVVRGLLGV